MPTTPYAKLLASINGGAPQSGAVSIEAGDEIQFSFESVIGWKTAYIEIYSYPLEWAGPGAPWVQTQALNADGVAYDVFRYLGNAVAPPAFTAPDIEQWGKILPMLVVNDGLVGGSANPRMRDLSLALAMTREGFNDLAWREGTQFGGVQGWVKHHRENIRRMSALAADLLAATDDFNNGTWKSAVHGVAAADVPNKAAFVVAQGDRTYVEGERVFLGPNQSTAQATSIGIWEVGEVTTGTAPLTRTSDANSATKLLRATFRVLEGTYAGAVFEITNTGIVLDTTVLTYKHGGFAKRTVAGLHYVDYVEGSGTPAGTGLVRGASGATFAASKTSVGGFDNVGLSDTGADVWKIGNATRAAGIELSVKTGGVTEHKVNDVVGVTLRATGVNVASGLFYSVNGVDHATAATASSLAFRGSSGELSVGYLYSAGTVAGAGFVRLSRNFTAIACKTAGNNDHSILAEDNSDGFVWGAALYTASHTYHVKTGGSFVWKINDGAVITGSATGINVPTGLVYAVNGVGHATAATASSLAFRGSSGELSVGYLYSGGTVAGTGFIRLSRNFTGIACKTAANNDHSVLAEDNADGFTWGAALYTASQTYHVKTGGSFVWKINDGTIITGSATGINLPTGLVYAVNGVGHTSAPTALSLMFRDAAGRAQAVSPNAADDLVIKSYADALGATAATADTIARRTSGTALLQASGFTNGSGTKASAGTLRASSTENAVVFRNAGNSADLTAVSIQGGDDWLQLGAATGWQGCKIIVAAGKPFDVIAGGSTLFEIDGTGAYLLGAVNLPSGSLQLAADTFITDDGTDLHIDCGALGMKLTMAGFGAFGTAPVGKPTVTGSRGGNAALASLLTGLANLGWITNSTTA